MEEARVRLLEEPEEEPREDAGERRRRAAEAAEARLRLSGERPRQEVKEPDPPGAPREPAELEMVERAAEVEAVEAEAEEPESSAATPALATSGRAVLLCSDVERCCFICLDGAEERDLVSCCSQCFTVVHVACWRSWRQSQRLAHLRTRVLGGRDESIGVLVCSVCKSGDALVEGEDLSWLDDSIGQEPARIRCSWATIAMSVVYALVLSAALVGSFRWFYPGPVVFVAVVFTYELVLAQVLHMVLRMRIRSALSHASHAHQIDPESDVELGLMS